MASALVAWLIGFLLLGGAARWLLGALQGLGRLSSAVAVAASLASGAWLAWSVPLQPAPVSSGEVTVQALGTKNERAVSSEVWARLEVDGKSMSPSVFTQDGKWKLDGEFLLSVPGAQPATFSWSGTYLEQLRLVFVSHPWSGKVRVTSQGKTEDLDLYAAVATGRVVTLGGITGTPHALESPALSQAQRWVRLCDVLVLALLVLSSFLWLSRAPSPAASPIQRSLGFETAAYSLPTFVAGCWCVALYHPALMTSDSLDQWRQAMTGHFNDAHPLLYGFFFKAIISLGGGAAAAALTQLGFFAASAGWLIAVTRRATGAPSWTGAAGATLLALYPMTTLTAVTLWKDVPYTAAVVALTALVVGAVFLERPRLKTAGGVAALAGLMFLSMSMRHNGPPVAVVALVVLWFMRPGERRYLAVSGLAALGALVLLKGPVTSFISANRANASFVIFAHHLAAHAARGHLPSDGEDLSVLKDVNRGAGDWRYNCATVNPTLFSPDFNITAASQNGPRLMKIWGQLALSRPDIELDHLICSSGLLWRMTESPIDPLYLSGIALWAPEGRVRWIISQPGDPEEASLAPEAAQWLGELVLQREAEFLWRPAGFLLLLCFLTLVAWTRSGDRRVLIIPALALTHTAALALAVVAQDARYQLPVYVVALATAPCLAGARRASESVNSRMR